MVDYCVEVQRFSIFRPASQIKVYVIAINAPRPTLDVSDGRGSLAAVDKNRNCKIEAALFRPIGVETMCG